MIAFTPYWMTTGSPAAGEEMALPERADVVVIGSGYTGLSAARQLARHGAQVAVLEQGEIGSGASSRSGGQVLTGLKLGASELVARFGAGRARELFAASLSAIGAVEALVAEERIDCEFRRCGHIEAAFKPDHFEAMKRERDVLAGEFRHEVRLVDRRGQRSELGSDFYHGLLVDPASATLHPARYVLGLAAAARRAGATLHEHTRMTGITQQGLGFTVRTASGAAIEAKDVLVATNGYTPRSVPAVARRVVPISSSIIATEPLAPERAATLLPGRRAVFDSKNFVYYFRLSSDDRMLFGGRARFTPAGASARRDAGILRRGLLEVFPELAGARIDYAWSGKVAFTRDMFPHLGSFDGIHYAVGYCGHGVALATHLGTAVADMMLGREARTPFRQLPFPTIPCYRGTPWFLPLVGAWYKLLDWID